ncbi:hypothetical protein GCM10017783_16360 [Deinococcus piscis]|uniref:Uncharacterized protein n=1 Tax=Deinococcus piscis TaxID=394230 RepID=A0ABQ3K5Y0_9DEIO|nr:hypothetical protein [Deinococcus piscis]GHG04466.1 hypothetical protein GCM10017783_16360 [Deinococcus piscis]
MSNLSVACPHCAQSLPVEYADRLIYDLICPHCMQPFCLFVRRQKFEVLFELGTEALLAGYAREAVSSFAAALERCFEFYVRAYALEQAAGQGLSLEEAQAHLDATWRLVDRQSERQTGMLALAYLLREGRPPEFLRPQALGSEFRNAVIHRGALPRRDEVEDYAAQVFGIIDRLLSELGSATLQVQALDELEFSRHFAALPPGTPAVTQEHPGLFRARMHGRFQTENDGTPEFLHGPLPATKVSGTAAQDAARAAFEAPLNRTPAEIFRAALSDYRAVHTEPDSDL